MKKQENPEETLFTVEGMTIHGLEPEVLEAAPEAASEEPEASADEEEAGAAQPVEDEEVAEQKSAIQQLKDFVNEDEDQPFRFNLNFKALIGGDGLSRLVANNWFFILVVVSFTCCYVTSRYMMESAVLENNTLTDTLLDRRYKALTLNSELLEQTLSSHIERHLTDSTIHTPTDQAFPLKTN